MQISLPKVFILGKTHKAGLQVIFIGIKWSHGQRKSQVIDRDFSLYLSNIGKFFKNWRLLPKKIKAPKGL